jgi:hypothetical protein
VCVVAGVAPVADAATVVEMCNGSDIAKTRELQRTILAVARAASTDEGAYKCAMLAVLLAPARTVCSGVPACWTLNSPRLPPPVHFGLVKPPTLGMQTLSSLTPFSTFITAADSLVELSSANAALRRPPRRGFTAVACQRTALRGQATRAKTRPCSRWT